ncbi:hypothetical protein G7K_1469-t1 [Saitoella complicata NRRL Y-17804]|uniref:Neurochondrin-domain-containing protein n=1 Tax=Saitoella complicata (strain BCRC 22490 / CBS 7301 / JCM 7358 / NBRC 10748 / NRRL Y-17804) TaxID=698492 RepID=A0A0E9NBP3_SAICN|nr:hypothetical protein G7K_1469-t1 [Saitoella complicata NRRL Y-17804]
MSTSTNAKDLQQCLTLLKASDDTSKFVALTIIPAILSRDPSLAPVCWAALSHSFIDRLLRTKSRTDEQNSANDLHELAVMILHSFATYPGLAEDGHMLAQVPTIFKTLRISNPTTTKLTFELLQRISSTRSGASSLAEAEYINVLAQVVTDHTEYTSLVLPILQLVFAKAESPTFTSTSVIDNVLVTLATDFRSRAEDVQLCLLDFFYNILTALPSTLWISDESLSWQRELILGLRQLTLNKQGTKVRGQVSQILAAVMNIRGFGSVFQLPPSTAATEQQSTVFDTKFAMLVVNLAAVDIRATLTDLMKDLASPEYQLTATRLAADYDILVAVISYLVTPDEVGCLFEPSDLLKLQKAITDAFSETMDFLRERWDAARVGAMGLRGDDAEGLPALGWDTSSEGGIARDVMIVSAVRALSLWLQEDEGLRHTAGGIVDVFLGLFKEGASVGVDYRGWVTSALQWVVCERNGREVFLNEGGWALVSADLKKLASRSSGSSDTDLQIGILEARVLLNVLENVDSVRKPWLDIAQTAGRYSNTAANGVACQFWAEITSLSCALLAKAPTEDVNGSLRRKLMANGEALQEMGVQVDYLADLKLS